MSSDARIKKTIIVALGVCLVCSVLVSTAAVGLNAIQEENKKRDKIKNILVASDLYEDESTIQGIYNEKIKPLMIDLETGEIVKEEMNEEILNIETFNVKDVADDSKFGKELSADIDIAQIKRVPRYMVIY